MRDDCRDFQRAFAAHLRDPHHTPRPAGVPERRGAVYGELVFNNVCGFLDACFPVSRAVLGEARWRRLNRTFLRDRPLHTPWFREIPREFVRYLAEARIATRRPTWLAELAHYEWLELAVDVMETAKIAADPAGDLLDRPLALNPAMQSFAAHWPVHRISPDWRPRKRCATHLVVYRDAGERVRFSEINPVTARLLTLLAEPDTTGRAAIAQVGAELSHPEPERLLAFGHALLRDLCTQGIILGAKS